jgi:hypothetical protein
MAPPPVTLSEDIVAVVMRSVDMKTGTTLWANLNKFHRIKKPFICTALKCRVVCKAWKRIVQEAGLHPIEAGKKGDALEAGCTPFLLV